MLLLGFGRVLGAGGEVRQIADMPPSEPTLNTTRLLLVKLRDLLDQQLELQPRLTAARLTLDEATRLEAEIRFLYGQLEAIVGPPAGKQEVRDTTPAPGPLQLGSGLRSRADRSDTEPSMQAYKDEDKK